MFYINSIANLQTQTTITVFQKKGDTLEVIEFDNVPRNTGLVNKLGVCIARIECREPIGFRISEKV